MRDRQENVTKYFNLLNYWTENSTFLNSVANCWKNKVLGNPIWILNAKMRRLSNTLSIWSKKENGDIFAKKPKNMRQ